MLRLESGDRKFLLFNFNSGYTKRDIKIIYYSILFLIKKNRISATELFYSLNLNNEEGNAIFIKLELEDGSTIDTGIRTYPSDLTMTHWIAVKDGNPINDLKIEVAYVSREVDRNGCSLMSINGNKIEEEYWIEYLYSSSLTLSYINNKLKEHFSQYELISSNRVLFNDSVVVYIEETHRDYLEAVKLLRDCYILTYFNDEKITNCQDNGKCRIVVWASSSYLVNANNSLLNLLEDAVSDLGIHLLFLDRDDD